MVDEPRAVLDASAIVAVLFKERGHEAVVQIIKAGAVVTPTGLAEALTVARRKGHRRSTTELMDDLGELGLMVEPIDADDAEAMADLLRRSDELDDPRLGSLSLGDAACLAVAKRLHLPAVASDGTWEVLDTDITVLPVR